MATTEHTINDALAAVLRKTRKAWHNNEILRSENTGLLKGSAKRPDIIIVEPNVSPVVIEAELIPAVSVEAEARERLGEQIRGTGRTILSAVAVRLPRCLREISSEALRTELEKIRDFEIALYTGTSPSDSLRWPQSGWLRGSAYDISSLALSASVPPVVIEKATQWLVSGVSEAAALISEMASSHPGALQKICTELRQHDGEQTRRMAATIIVNAFVFQDSLAGGPGDLSDVQTVDEIRDTQGWLSKSAVLREWQKILKVNYWPIFDIARRILKVIPSSFSKALIDRLENTAARLLDNRLMRSHDLTGAVFQRLIADRKFLAAYYTTPASAALLAGLTILPERTPANGSWSSVEDVKSLRIADFACGTGTLLSTAYQRIGQLHELAGGDAKELHSSMMANSLIGCDVLPAAAHLTASMLAGAHPTTKYMQSLIMTVAYGRQPDDSVALGSLDLLDPQGKLGILAVTAFAAESMGKKERDIWLALPHSTFDLVLMNPPFTRATGHEGKKIGVPNPMFAAFNSTSEEQKAMATATGRLTAGTSVHGNAGEASIFLVLANRKLKEEGTLALVMPLSLMSGDAWEASRQLLRKSYSDLIFVSISGASSAQLSFSADTGMGECLVIGRKRVADKKRATFVILNEPPSSSLLGAISAQHIHCLISTGSLRRLEDGPVGGSSICFGDDYIGYAIDAPLPSKGGCHLARISDVTLAQTAYQLCDKKQLWLPSMDESESIKLPITTINEIGKIGPYHMDVSGNTANGGVRGPFKIMNAKPGMVSTYPILWTHDADRERTMSFEGDSEGIVRQGNDKIEEALIREKVAKIWAEASHCHFNRDFRFNSQSTAMQFTQRRTIGGRAWLSIKLDKVEEEKALTAWANTSLGLLLYWWHSNKQQPGRGSIGKSALQSLNVLDVTALSNEKMNAAVKIFEDLKSRELRPFNEIDKDPVRQELDERFMNEVLDLPAQITTVDGPLGILRSKLAVEPSIKAGKLSKIYKQGLKSAEE